MKNIALIGFMGTGKTSVGKKLAQDLGYSFVDTDQEVERITGLTVAEIFKKHGEIRFRSEESLALKRLLKAEGQVIATGGGIVLKPENVGLLKEQTFVVALTARPEVIYQRVETRDSRPLLKGGDLMAKIIQLMEERKDAYDFADLVVDTSELSPRMIADKIAQALREIERNQS